MEVERGWAATIFDEEEGSGLEIRQRRRGEMGNSTVMEKREEVVGREFSEVAEEEEVISRMGVTIATHVINRTQIFETKEHPIEYISNQGVWKCRHCTWTYHLSSPDIDHTQKHGGNCRVAAGLETLTQLGTCIDSSVKALTEFNTIPDEIREDRVAEEKNPNGKVDARTKVIYLGNIFAEHEDKVTTKELSNRTIPIGEEDHQHLKIGVVDNGLNSHLISENGIIQHEHEIDESEQLRPGRSHKLKDIEFDVERVLEEQETHDLVCPDCNSCITKRVILRKRKRASDIVPYLRGRPTEASHEDKTAQYILPYLKLPVYEGDVAPAATTEATTEAVHEDEPVFRCLSCFSIFIPRDGGFNIFQLFGRREANTNLQSSEQVPARNKNWFYYIFRRGTKNEGTEEGLSLPCESTIIPGKQMAGSFVRPQCSPTITIYPRIHGRIVPPSGNFQPNQNVSVSVPPSAIVEPHGGYTDMPTDVSKPHTAETVIDVGSQSVLEPRRNNDWDMLKSIVYGGLIESITSLSVVSSAAGTDTSTLNICAMGLANLVGGLFVIVHALFELRSNPKPEATDLIREKPADRYWELLGRRENFRRHIVLSILSYIIFGLLPPVIYGLSFRKSDNKEYKLIAVAVASLFSITLLGIGKAHVKPQKEYIKCLSYYIMLGVSGSGISYVAGVLIDKLLVELGVFDQNAPPSSSIDFLGIGSGASWTSH